MEDDDRYTVELILDEDYYGAILNLSKEYFEKNKEQIIKILKSIKILQDY